MKIQWFIFDKQIVSGPHTTETVQENIKIGKWTDKSKIWWKGQRDWLPVSEWQDKLEYLSNIENHEEKIWYVEREGDTYGPIAKTEMIDLLASLKNLSKVRIWKKGQEKWATVYQYNDIANSLGITRRKVPRAPIIGEVVITKNHIDMQTQLSVISAGGLGVHNASGLKTGDIVQISIRSPLLVSNINSQAEVRHVTDQGYAGLMFQGIHSEYESTIIDYVKQFENQPEIKEVA